MIRLSFLNTEDLKRMHFEAVKSYVKNTMRMEWCKDFYSCVIALSGFEAYNKGYDERRDTFGWLK